MADAGSHPGKTPVHESAGSELREETAIAGVGASAGGLDAFTRLLKNLPANPGMALVLVQHLEPNHASHLADILSKSTVLPVAEARDGMAIEVDHVYVIPPNANMALEEGKLRLTPRGDAHGPHLPIDFFLSSLARDASRRCIGIILSGTGADGTLGLAEIKAAGGITFAQDSESAKYPAMPVSAVEDGIVDKVMSPEDIAIELGRIGSHAYFRDSLPERNDGHFKGCEKEFNRIVSMLRDHSGVDFTQYRETTLKRRILRRMALGKVDTLPEYHGLLLAHPEEVKALYQDVLIHVTRFFRDPEAFETLSEAILPAIWKAKPAEGAIRVWVAGCATGEEAYSLAMLLCEYQETMDTRYPLRIFASDISESPALERARAGLYSGTIEQDVSPGRLARFFVKEESGYRIKKEIREICIFARHDVTMDPPFARLDLISCRNLLIYLSAPLQRRVIPSFHYALNAVGFLLLGNSETIGRETELFRPADAHVKVYAKKMASPRLPDLASKLRPAQAPAKAGRLQHLPAAQDYQQAADRLVLRKFAPPGVIVNKDMDVLQFRGRTSPFLEPPLRGSGFNLATMAQEGLSLEISKAIAESDDSGLPAVRKDVRLLDGESIRKVDLEIHPLQLSASAAPCFLVLFGESERGAALGSPVAVPRRISPAEGEVIALLRAELDASREYIQAIREQAEATSEEMKASGEEMESSNEELQSTNEELETAKEELQSGNEELATMNDELRTRNQEQAQLNDDLSNLLSSVQIPIVILGEDLRLRRFTPAAGEMLILSGRDVGRPIGSLTSFLPDLDIGKAVSDVIVSQESSVREIRNQNGLWHALRIHPYRTSDGNIEGVVMVLLDIDAIKRAQVELQESGDYARSIVDTVRDPMLILEQDMRVHSANLSYYRFFGTTPAETEGRPLAEVGDGLWTTPEAVGFLSRLNSLPEDAGDCEVRHGMPSGPATLVFNARRLPAVSGRGSMTLVSVEDITERKQSEAALQESQDKLRQSQRMEAIGKLAGGVAHDFNNLLTAINGYSALCLIKAPREGDLHAYLEEILKAGERAAVLTRQLLAYSRKQMLSLKLLDLNGVVSNMHNMLARLIGSHFQLRLSLEERLCLVKADPGQMEQVLINLVVNARDAMPLGGEIILGTANLDLGEEEPLADPSVPRGSYAVLSIADKGTGMDAEVLKRLFEPFFTTKALGKGTGLGLSVVQGIISQTGGHILVESSPEAGTEFRILLPREKKWEMTYVSVETPHGHPARRTETVLLVDDEDVVRSFTRKVLESQGYKVLEANTGESALLLNSRNKDGVIDILVSDMVMPGMGGAELADTFLASRPNGKVLLMSGYSEDTGIIRNKPTQNTLHFIHKPFSPTSFALAVQETLDARPDLTPPKMA